VTCCTLAGGILGCDMVYSGRKKISISVNGVITQKFTIYLSSATKTTLLLCYGGRGGGHTEDGCIQSESCAKTVSLNEYYKVYCYFNIFSYPITDLSRPLGLQEFEAPRISIDGCQSYTPAVFTSSSDNIDGTHFC